MSDNKLKKEVKNKGWMRSLPQITERDFLVVEEVAEILIANGIINKTNVRNKYGKANTNGIQQVRKYIRNGEINGKLYLGSKKYGYIIEKIEVELFCQKKKDELKKKYEDYLKKLNGEFKGEAEDV